MNETEIKTRLGLILQGVLAVAIRQAGYPAVQDHQYDPTCEKPDFLIPNASRPSYMVEVHQTEARNSFQMKTLRAFTAVTEAKAHYGDKVISVNILFGDPDRELPVSNVQALGGVFDVNLIPRRLIAGKVAVAKMEKAALAAAADEDYGNKTAQATRDVAAAHPNAVKALASMLRKSLAVAKARPELFPMWKAERKRMAKLGTSPKSGARTYYKRGLLGSLFLSDADFVELLAKKDPSKCSASVQRQVVLAGLAKLEELIEGDQLTLDTEFREFLENPLAAHLNALCREDLAATSELKWFFEDIHHDDRRMKMARAFLREARHGGARFRRAFSQAFRTTNAFGITHARCWFADLMPLAVGKSHNYFNRAMYGHPDYNVPLGNPYNNIAIRAPRLGINPVVLDLLERLACETFFHTVTREGVDLRAITERGLADALLAFRLGAAIKLRKLDPLLLVVADVASEYGLESGIEPVPNAIADLANLAGAGTFRVPVLTHRESGKRVLLNAVAVHDRHGDDKSKEWGARRLATLYRFRDGAVRLSGLEEGLFVLDGEWEDKDVARLYRCGWTHICRMGELGDTLKEVFSLKGKVALKRRRAALFVEEGDEDA